jgi:hypothetical protein
LEVVLKQAQTIKNPRLKGSGGFINQKSKMSYQNFHRLFFTPAASIAFWLINV